MVLYGVMFMLFTSLICQHASIMITTFDDALIPNITVNFFDPATYDNPLWRKTIFWRTDLREHDPNSISDLVNLGYLLTILMCVYDHRWWVSYFATRQCGWRTETSPSSQSCLLDRWIKQCDSNSFQTLKPLKSFGKYIPVTCNQRLRNWRLRNAKFLLIIRVIYKHFIYSSSSSSSYDYYY
jgi:hypothetical protein